MAFIQWVNRFINLFIDATTTLKSTASVERPMSDTISDFGTAVAKLVSEGINRYSADQQAAIAQAVASGGKINLSVTLPCGLIQACLVDLKGESTHLFTLSQKPDKRDLN